MKIGFDFHGVIEKYPDVFRPLMESLRAMGAEIFIVSGPPLNQLIYEVASFEYLVDKHWDNLISVIDYIKKIGKKTWQDEKGDWWTDDESFWSSKSMICEEYGIDLLIDDSVQYQKYFEGKKTQFVLFKDCNFDEMLTGIVNIFKG
jgi:hypothetical protein